MDWQSICTSAPEQDLAYFITQSVPPAVRAQEDLVAFYHAEHTRRGVDYDLAFCREALSCECVVLAVLSPL